MSTTRKVYLISFSVRNGRDHWGLYFPSTTNESAGKIIHVVGAPLLGFKHEVKHYWDTTKTSAKFTLYLLGETDAVNIIDAEPSSTSAPAMQVSDVLNKADKFENRANRLQAPGIAPEHLRPKGTVTQITAGWAKDIPGVKRCQEWTTELIDDLVNQGLLPKSALTERDAAKALRNTE